MISILLFSTLLALAQPIPATANEAFPLDRNELVAAKLAYYRDTRAGHRWQEGVFERLQKYRDMIAARARGRGVPEEFMMIAALESGFNPRAVSKRGPAGLWQFMPGTARKFGLKVVRKTKDRPGVDERLDPEKSTDAAMKYLAALHKEFGDWRLVLLAYNEGEEGVRRAMARLRTRDPWVIERKRVHPRPSYLAAVTALAVLYNDRAETRPGNPDTK